MFMTIRPETLADIAAIYYVNEAAFGRPEEARLVDALRQNHRVTLSLVAEEEGEIVGHILFFPLHIGKHSSLGLGPMAVVPSHQKQGIGSQLVRAGIEALRKSRHTGIVVLVHPEFYPRFGFEKASKYGITCPFEVPDEAFMALELRDGAMANISGRVEYSPEFSEV
ncbi:N-acetyltransferase [bacterium]|nr:MAG: N-acetyltransferase [bacterium]